MQYLKRWENIGSLLQKQREIVSSGVSIMIYILSVLIGVFLIVQYIAGKHANVLTGLMLCAIFFYEPNLDFIGLDSVSLRSLGQNSFFFTVSFILLFKLGRHKVENSREITKIEKIALLIFVYVVLIALYTFVTGKESLFNIIALMKPYTAVLSIFFIKDISAENCKKSIRTIFKLTACVGVIAILQAIFRFNIFGSSSLDYFDSDRFWSPYSMASLCLFISLIILEKRKTAFFVFFLVLVLLPLRRGLIISVAGTLIVYYFYQFRQGVLNKSVVWVVLVGVLSFSVLLNRFTANEDNALEDLKVLSSGQADYEGKNVSTLDGGSFLFRILILVERAEYLVDNPTKLLTGVGLIHEDTAQKSFNFFLGSRKTVNGEVTYQQIDCEDIVWPPILMRLGLVGLLLYLLLFFTLLNLYYSNFKYTSWAIVGFCILFNYMVFSIADYQLTDYHAFLLYYIVLRIVVSEKCECS